MFRISLFLLIFCFLVGCNSPAEETVPPPTLSPMAQAGKSYFQLHCATCHATVPDVVVVGPSLAGIAENAGNRVPNQTATEYLLTSIIRPDDFVMEGFAEAMPKDFGKKLTGEEVDAIVTYLLTLE